MKKKLNDKQISFCEEYIRTGGNGSASYRFAYPDSDEKNSRINACVLLKNPLVQDKLDEIEGSYKTLAFENGVDKKTIVKVIKEMLSANKTIISKTGESIDSPDWTARNNAIITLGKFTGDLTERKKIEYEEKESLSDIDPEKLTEEERKELERKLLEELE